MKNFSFVAYSSNKLVGEKFAPFLAQDQLSKHPAQDGVKMIYQIKVFTAAYKYLFLSFVYISKSNKILIV